MLKSDSFSSFFCSPPSNLARSEQIAVKTQYLASQAAQDREEFERVLQAQKELIAAEEAKQREEAVRKCILALKRELRAECYSSHHPHHLIVV